MHKYALSCMFSHRHFLLTNRKQAILHLCKARRVMTHTFDLGVSTTPQPETNLDVQDISHGAFCTSVVCIRASVGI